MGGHVYSNRDSRRMLSGGTTNHYYQVDARGTDPVLTEYRVRKAVIAAHDSAISNAVQVQQERAKRVPPSR